MRNVLDRLLKLIDDLADGKPTIFAKKAGIPPSTFQYYKEGRMPSGEHLIRIYETYKVNITWLLTGEGPIYILGENESDLDPDPEIARLLDGARRVLKSGNPVAFDALERNIKYFDHAVRQEKRMADLERTMNDLMKEMDELKRAGKGKCPAGDQSSGEQAA